PRARVFWSRSPEGARDAWSFAARGRTCSPPARRTGEALPSSRAGGRRSLAVRRHHRRRLLVPYEPVQEVAASAEDVDPTTVDQRLVDVVGNDGELVVDTARAEQVDESDHLREVDVAVVVTLFEEHWRFPAVYRAHGGRSKGEARRVLGIPIDVD